MNAGATASPQSSAAVPPLAPTTKSSKKKKKSQVMVTMATAPSSSQAGGAPGENTGRWTAEEHRLFLQGLEQHGKGWKKIASLIKSRTVVQIRTHAQKYFQKLSKARQNGEEGEISMEGRGGPLSLPSMVPTAAQTNKRRRQTSGTKRKFIQSVVASAQRQGKKIGAARAAAGQAKPKASIPAVAPALQPFVLPNQPVPTSSQPPSPEALSAALLEDSLYVVAVF
jgi:SHAQKYF class myb-like DNA-binding protein